MERLHDCIANEELIAVLRRDDFSWLWSNVSEEISQCLYCMFGYVLEASRNVSFVGGFPFVSSGDTQNDDEP